MPLLFILLVFFACNKKESVDTQRITLPNGWSLSPVGESLPLGDLPLNMVMTPDQRYAVVTNNGQSTHSLMLVDLMVDQIAHTMEIPKAWMGLARMWVG